MNDVTKSCETCRHKSEYVYEEYGQELVSGWCDKLHERIIKGCDGTLYEPEDEDNG